MQDVILKGLALTYLLMQVISTELNNVVVELLQQLLFWQERSKAINIHNATKKKRLVSGLREVETLLVEQRLGGSTLLFCHN